MFRFDEWWISNEPVLAATGQRDRHIDTRDGYQGVRRVACDKRRTAVGCVVRCKERLLFANNDSE